MALSISAIYNLSICGRTVAFALLKNHLGFMKPKDLSFFSGFPLYVLACLSFVPFSKNLALNVPEPSFLVPIMCTLPSNSSPYSPLTLDAITASSILSIYFPLLLPLRRIEDDKFACVCFFNSCSAFPIARLTTPFISFCVKSQKAANTSSTLVSIPPLFIYQLCYYYFLLHFSVSIYAYDPVKFVSILYI